MQNKRALFVAGLVAITVFSRLLPHPPNFTAMGAAAVLGGGMLSRRASLCIPLVCMLLTDAFIGFHALVVPVYLSLGLSALIGWRHSHSKASTGAYLVSGLLSAGIFFITTNFAVWLTSGMYPLNGRGLIDCYVAAIPYLGNMILADSLFLIVFQRFTAWIFVDSLSTFSSADHPTLSVD